jgi:xanthine dehydrogenase YagR molybdenum-binding subunit
MEPHATTAVWDGDRLTTYDATQFVPGQPRNVAAILGVDEVNVRVICPFIGGGFGSKQDRFAFNKTLAGSISARSGKIRLVQAKFKTRFGQGG